MYPGNSFSSQLKDIFLNHRGRFARATFAVTFAALLLFMSITSPLLYKFCGLFLPMFMVVLLVLVYAIYMTYALFVLCIKRLHDMNLAGWYSVALLIPFFNFVFIAYLCLKKGDLGDNSYGGALVDYQGPSVLLFFSYAVLLVYAGFTGVGLYYGVKLRDIQNTGQGAQKMIGVLPKKIQAELKNTPRAMGVLFVNSQFAGPAVSITKSRILVQGTDLKRTIQSVLSQKGKVEIRFPDNSQANITQFVSSDDSLSVQMAVFEMDKPIGTPPAKLGERNRKLLENINAF